MGLQETVNEYFSQHWKPRSQTSLGGYQYSSQALLNKVSDQELVLDVGCGYHPFKGKIKNLIGIDPANVAADYVETIERFAEHAAFRMMPKFDVAFCLGSINFGAESNIKAQVGAVISLLKPQSRIYWRCNPGNHDHKNNQFSNIEVFPWTFRHHEVWAKEFGFTLKELTWDIHEDSHQRIYAEWQRGS